MFHPADFYQMCIRDRVRYVLERCRTVEEAIEAIRELPVGSAQAITLADRSGAVAVVECNCCLLYTSGLGVAKLRSRPGKTARIRSPDKCIQIAQFHFPISLCGIEIFESPYNIFQFYRIVKACYTECRNQTKPTRRNPHEYHCNRKPSLP